MGYIFKKTWTDKETGKVYEGKNWMLKYYRHGKAYIESSRSTKQKVAKNLLNQREGNIAEGKVPGVHFEKVTFDELAETFIKDYRINRRDTLDKAERSVRHLKESFEGMRVTDITTDKIQAYIDKRLKAGLSNASVNRELAALKKMLHLGKRAGKVNEIPYIPMLQESNVRKGFFEYAEYEALYKELPDYLKPILTFGYLTSWRKGEITNLTWSKVDLKEGTITLDPDETKNEEGRTICLTDELAGLMHKQFSQRRTHCPYVFHHDGKQIRDFREAWKNACIRAGLWEPKKDEEGNIIKVKDKRGQEKIIKVPTKIFHDLRRTAVRDMVRSGIPEKVVMAISGHKTRSVFDRYNIVSNADLKEAAKVRQAHLEKQKANFVPLDVERGEIKEFKRAQNQ